jgi:hypothetical protein
MLAKDGTVFGDLSAYEQYQLKMQAVKKAQDCIFDYGDRPEWLSWASKNLGSFGTYQYKMTGLAGRTLRDNPGRIAAVVKFAQLTSPWVDWTYFIPFGDVADNLKEYGPVKGTLLNVAGAAPAIFGLSAAVLGRDPRRGYSVLKDKSPFRDQVGQWGGNMMRFLGPSYQPPSFDERGGSWYEQVKKLTGSWNPETHSWQRETPTAADWLKPAGVTLAGARRKGGPPRPPTFAKPHKPRR